MSTGSYGNPTQQETERKLAAIEGAESALRQSMGIVDNLVGLALGLEDADDSAVDLDQALQRL